MSISEDSVVKSGSEIDSVQIPSEYGGGYMATLEFTHQLHCVVSLTLYKEFEIHCCITADGFNPRTFYEWQPIATITNLKRKSSQTPQR